MKNNFLVIYLALASYFFAACSKQTQSKTATIDEWTSDSIITVSPQVSISALHSGMTVRDVIVELGSPSRTNAAGLEFSSLGLFICPSKNEYTLIPPYAGRTKNGIGIGSSRADVVKAYGQPKEAKITGPGFELLKYDLLGLKFQLHSGVVDWIDVVPINSK